MEKKSKVLPVYLAAAIWPIYACILPLYRPWHFAVAGAVSLVTGLIGASLCQEPKPAPDVPTPQTEAEQAAEDPALAKMLTDGAQAITEMRRLNERIQDEKVSAAIDQMERISGKIFAQVQSDPEKLPQIRRFMDYYLPTTLKLLRAYDEMSSQGVAGENISGTMAKVEQMLDTIVTAFARQLDGLFGADAMDISTDISAMEAMLAREGLTGEQLTAETIKNMDGTDIKLE